MNPFRRLNVAADMMGFPKDVGSALRILRRTVRLLLKNRSLVFFVILPAVLCQVLLSLAINSLFEPPPHGGPPLPWPSIKLQRGPPAPRPPGPPPPLVNVFMVLVGLLGGVVHLSLAFFEVLITTFAASSTCSGVHASTIELLRRISREWTGPVLTVFYVAIIRKGYWVVVGIFIAGFPTSVATAGGLDGFLLTALGGLLTISCYLLYYYFDAGWACGPAASIADGCGGLSALGNAAVVTARRRRRGVFLALFCGIAYGVVGLAYHLLARLFMMAKPVEVAIAVCYRSAFELLNLFQAAAFAVYYYKCEAAADQNGQECPYSALC